MRDVQKDYDPRDIPINKVGIKNLKYPIEVLDKSNRMQKTVAEINMYVDLPHNFKGTHMSRFIEILNRFRGKITYEEIEKLLIEVKNEFKAKTSRIELIFPYFIEKQAPVTGSKGIVEYTGKFIASYNETYDFVLGTTVPVTTLCPCSKGISKKGAHNQRALVSVYISSRKFCWLEDLIRLIEDSASSEIFSLLKREDEKCVTEKAYENPKFVEDVVRDIAERLNSDPNIISYTIECESMESIHNHNAYAYIEKR